eukprot:symbB.v1.2.022115.t1/scaffold1904.1/size96468/2
MGFMFVDGELLMPGLTRTRSRAHAAPPPEVTAPAAGLDSFGPDEWAWPEAMATASCLRPCSVLALRTLLAASYIGHACYDVTTYYDSGFYFMYLTHISLFLQVLCSIFLVAATFLSLGQLHRLADSPAPLEPVKVEAPVTCSIALVLFSLQLPLSLMVVFMYWTLEVPIWSLPGGYHTTYDDLYVHGFQSLGMLLTFLFSRIPFRIRQWGWLMFAGVLYNIWTYLQYILKIGTLDGCSDYPREECPIYGVFDWHKGGSTLLLGSMLVLVACPSVMFIFSMLGLLRDACDPGEESLMDLEDSSDSKDSETELS